MSIKSNSTDMHTTDQQRTFPTQNVNEVSRCHKSIFCSQLENIMRNTLLSFISIVITDCYLSARESVFSFSLFLSES